jgi:hypothetical protein
VIGCASGWKMMLDLEAKCYSSGTLGTELNS